MSAASKKEETVIEDYLDEDDPMPGQKYALVSFLSPENVLDKKELFFFERFLQSYEVDWKIKNLEAFLADTVTGVNTKLEEKAKALEKEGNTEAAEAYRKNRLPVESVLGDYQTFVRERQKQINKTTIKTAWDDFLFKEQAKLEDEFHAKNNFRTTIRGLKVRCVARDEQEAQARAKRLQARDRYHNIFCAEVGKWTPWDPKPHMVAEQEYAQEELNQLMKKYRENEDSKAMFFEEQRKAGVAVPSADKTIFGAAAGEKKASMTVQAIADAGAGAGAGAGAAAAADAGTNVVVEGSAAAPVGAFNAVFEGPADLAMARKMGAKATETSTTTDASAEKAKTE
jgi:hypothetical protein